jgi:uncharacterized protein
MNKKQLLAFVRSFYAQKDIMHDLSHIERVLAAATMLARSVGLHDREVVTSAAYFHGFIYTDEAPIRRWLRARRMPPDRIDAVVRVAWESQQSSSPTTIEGKLLHDAHMIEGGKTFLIVKPLITGSLRGQTLRQTVRYIEEHVLGGGKCYLPAARRIRREQRAYAKVFIRELQAGLR